MRHASSEAIVAFGIGGIAGVLLQRPVTARTAVVHELKGLLQNGVRYSDAVCQVLLGLIGRLSGFTVLRRDVVQ